MKVKNKRMKPIESPKFIGCGTCSRTPNKVLDTKTIFYGYPHMSSINGVMIDDGTILQDVTGKENDIIFIDTPLRDETYQYQDGQWVLVKQGIGYA